MESFMGRKVKRHSPAEVDDELIEPGLGGVQYAQAKTSNPFKASAEEINKLNPPVEKPTPEQAKMDAEYNAAVRKLNIQRGMGNIKEDAWKKAHEELRKKYGK